MTDQFWEKVNSQLAGIRTATGAQEVVTILAPDQNPYGDASMVAGDGFFAGSGGDDTLWDALADAGWERLWASAPYHYAAVGPDGSVLTYIEGDVYLGDRR